MFATASRWGGFRLNEDVVDEVLVDEAVWGVGGRGRGRSVEAAVDGVELLAQLTPHVEPPVADEHRLAELCPVGAEERGLATIQVAVVPRLAPALRVGEEPGVLLVVAVEVRVGHLAQHWVVRTRTT